MFRKYSDSCDQELEDVVSDLQHRFPNTGIPIMSGHLQSRGLYIQRRRLIEALHNIEQSQRWHSLVRRRTYSVPGPNSLWHIDGHHRLIRWKIVVHGGIDGYSRLIVYLHASTNNRSNTVFNLFHKATQVFCVPTRVRSDKGGKNVDVCYFILLHRGEGRGSHIGGPSVHNQRIEHLWRDVFRCVCSLYHSLFYFMEATGILDSCNEEDMFVLHCVFVPRINVAWHYFARAWNLHPLRTVHNWSPKNIFLDGTLDESSASGFRDVVDDVPLESLNLLGIERLYESYSEIEQIGRVVVPLTPAPLSQDLLQKLLDSFDPFVECNDYGVHLYITVKQTLSTLMSLACV